MEHLQTPGPLLTGLQAVVTGGCRGIGGAVTRAFAAHGADVLCVDVDVTRPPVVDTSGAGEIRVVELDVTTSDAAARIAELSEPDVVVHNVGHFLRPPRLFMEERPEDWAAVFRTNVDHAFALTAALVPGMVARGRGGSIITLTTIEAYRAVPGHAAYSGAKGALEAWSRSMALEHGRDGIRFNTIAPDLIDTPQIPYRRQLVAAEDWWRWRLWAPLARPGAPEDVAGAALFLASPLSSFMTGTVLHVDGGSHAAGGWFPKEAGGWTNRPRNP